MEIPFTDTYVDTWIAVAVIAAAVVVVAGFVALIATAVRHGKNEQAGASSPGRTMNGAQTNGRAPYDGPPGQPERTLRVTRRELTDDEREHFAERWAMVRADFVDHPADALARADEMVASMLIARGYPAASTSVRAADLAAEYPSASRAYASAQAIAAACDANNATTEDMRRAMQYYGQVLESLMHEARRPVAVGA